MPPLRILVGADVHRDPNAGASGTVYQTNEALRALGHEVDEIWADDLGRRIQHGNLHYLFELPARYREVVRQRCQVTKYDVIQLSQPHAYLAAMDHNRSGRPGIFVNRSHGLELRVNSVMPKWHAHYHVPSSRFPRSIVSPFVSKRLERHWHEVARWSDCVILPCYEDRDFLLKKVRIEPDRVEVVHHGIPLNFIERPVAPMTPGRLNRILYIGQFAFIKGPHVLAKIVNKLLELHDGMSFTWVCSRDDHVKARNLISEKIRSRVNLMDWMPQNVLDSVYDTHGIFLFPSFFEGAGKACLEAMSRGLCVIASDTGAMRDYIRHGENGFLMDVGNPQGGVDAVIHATRHFAAAEVVSVGAHETARKYTWRRCAKHLVSYYEQVASAVESRLKTGRVVG